MNCVEYLCGAIKNIDSILEGNKADLKSFRAGNSPYPSTYRPELDVTNELDVEFIHRFQELIGVLRWSIELVRIDIIMEVSCLYQHLCSPCEGHLNVVYNIFRYLQTNTSKNQGSISFDTYCVHTYDNIFKVSTRELEDWKDCFPKEADAQTRKKLEPLGEPVTGWLYVDMNQAGNSSNRRSHSGILIYVNKAVIKIYRKR